MLMSYSPIIIKNTATLKKNKKTLSEYINKLQSQTEKRNTRELISLGVHAMNEGIGFSRVIFFAFDKNENSLKNYNQVIEKNLPVIKNITISLELNKLFNQLLSKEQILNINTQNQHKYCQFLPAALRPGQAQLLRQVVAVRLDRFACVQQLHLDAFSHVLANARIRVERASFLVGELHHDAVGATRSGAQQCGSLADVDAAAR